KQAIQKTLAQLESELKNSGKKPIDIKEYTEKVNKVIDTVTDSTVSEELKNKVLRTIIKDIIYDKQNKSFIVNFYA
ncbi:MAG: hypothetical protein ACI396_07530, partial [Acutalibacteraceae bacterium]